jgi:peptidoglycan/LPS O-acetylase OafA/YrhL
VTYTYNFVKWSPDYDGSRIFSHLWSLSVEEQFYLVYPLVVFALDRRNLARALVLVVALSPLLRYVAGDVASALGRSPENAGQIIFVSSFLHVDAFAIGGLIALFESAIVALRPHIFALAAGAWIAVAGAALVVNAVAWQAGHAPLAVEPYVVSASAFGLPVNPILRLQHVWVYSIIDISAGLAICVVLRSLQRPLRIARPFNAIGQISYGIYLYHFALISVFERAFAGIPKQSPAGLALFALYLTCVLALSALSFRFIEAPFNARKSLFSRRRPVVQAIGSEAR